MPEEAHRTDKTIKLRAAVVRDDSKKAVMMSSEVATHPLVRKIASFMSLSVPEQLALQNATRSLERVGAHVPLTLRRSGNPVLLVVLDGFACHYRVLSDGRRQITKYYVPGDVIGLRELVLPVTSGQVSTLSPVNLSSISLDALGQLHDTFPPLIGGLKVCAMLEARIATEWVVNVGQRTAFERTAHLFCEVFARLEIVGRTRGNLCEFPVTQSELADTLALSTVHVNRTLMELRRAHYIEIRDRSLTIQDFPALRLAADFDPSYLSAGDAQSVSTGWSDWRFV